MPDEAVAILVTKVLQAACKIEEEWSCDSKRVGQDPTLMVTIFVFAWTVHRLHKQRGITEKSSQNHGLHGNLCG